MCLIVRHSGRSGVILRGKAEEFQAENWHNFLPFQEERTTPTNSSCLRFEEIICKELETRLQLNYSLASNMERLLLAALPFYFMWHKGNKKGKFHI